MSLEKKLVISVKTGEVRTEDFEFTPSPPLPAPVMVDLAELKELADKKAEIIELANKKDEILAK